MDAALQAALRRWQSTPADTDAIRDLVRASRLAATPLPLEIDPERVLGAFVDRVHTTISQQNEQGYDWTAVGAPTPLRPPFTDLQAIRAAINRLPPLHSASWEGADPQGLPFPCQAALEVARVEALSELAWRSEGTDLSQVLAPFVTSEAYRISADYEPEDRRLSMYTSTTILIWLPLFEHAHLLVTQHHWGCWSPATPDAGP